MNIWWAVLRYGPQSLPNSKKLNDKFCWFQPKIQDVDDGFYDPKMIYCVNNNDDQVVKCTLQLIRSENDAQAVFAKRQRRPNCPWYPRPFSVKVDSSWWSQESFQFMMICLFSLALIRFERKTQKLLNLQTSAIGRRGSFKSVSFCQFQSTR